MTLKRVIQKAEQEINMICSENKLLHQAAIDFCMVLTHFFHIKIRQLINIEVFKYVLNLQRLSNSLTLNIGAAPLGQ